MANYSNLKAAIADVIKTNGTKAITGQVLQDTLNSIVSVIGANYQFAGVATPSTNPGTPDQNVFYIAMQGGTYTNFNATALPDGISLLMWNGSWSSQVISYNDGGVFDISVYKSTGGTLATFADLAAALGTNGANVPVAARKGGMSVKFVQGSDNNYVQYRLMADDWSTTVTDWQGVDDEPAEGSNNLVKSGGVYNTLLRSNILNLSINQAANTNISLEQGKTYYIFALCSTTFSNYIKVFILGNPSTAINIEQNTITEYTPSMSGVLRVDNVSGVALNNLYITVSNSDSALEQFVKLVKNRLESIQSEFSEMNSAKLNRNDYLSYNTGVINNLVPQENGLTVGGLNDSTGQETVNPDRTRTDYIEVSGDSFIKIVSSSIGAEVLCYKYENSNYTYLGYVSQYTAQGKFYFKDGTTHIRLYINTSEKLKTQQLLFIGVYEETLVQKKNLNNISKWNDISYNILKGYNSDLNADPDYFVIKLPVTAGSTIYIKSGVTSDPQSNRRVFVFNEKGIVKDNYGSTDGRNITFPSSDVAYMLATMSWSKREDVYILDNTGNEIFRYNKLADFQLLHKDKKIRIAQWNVGGFNSEWHWDGSEATKTEHTWVELLPLLKNTITEINADIIVMNEYVAEFDGHNIYDEVFKHFYPYHEELATMQIKNVIFSKYPMVAKQCYTANGYPLNYLRGWVQTDMYNKVAIACVHLTSSSASARISEIDGIKDIFDNEKFAIIAGDMNCGNNGESSTDIENQIEPFIDEGYEPSNRGYWGEKVTYYHPEVGLDNIFVKNGIINNFIVGNDRPGSDHFPIVSDIIMSE